MKTESTFFIKFTSIFLMAALTFLASPNRLEAQCQMACTDKVNASMDPITCQTIVTPSSLMNPTPGCPLTGYTVMVEYQGLTLGPADTVRIPKSWIGYTVKVSVMNTTGNRCWGNLLVEDKSAPVIECIDTIYNLYCFQSPARMRPDSLGVDVQDCSNFTWSARGLPTISECVDITVNGTATKALKRVTQNWAATDINGMRTECSISYNLLSIPEDSIQGPENDTLACSPAFATTSEGYPHPSVTGYPYFVIAPGDTFYLRPNEPNLAGACNINVNFSDRLIKKGKIIRTWIVSGWLCGDIFDNTYQQLILIVDNNLPSLAVAPASRTVTTSGHSCSAIVRLSNLFTPTATDACSPVVITAYLNDVLVNPNALITVPLGINAVRFEATDESGNVRTSTVSLTVEDKTPPTAICMKSTVAITNSGTARIPAAYFNNGSKDECSAVTFSVRRMDRRINCDTTTSPNFHPHVDFCCTDVGNNVMIELRVTDASGNSNTCMVEIEVQNKIRPTLVCPLNTSVACNTPVVLDSAGLASRFGVATVASGCGTPTVRHTFQNNRDQCGVGTIVRKWVVFNGSARVDSCTQTIQFNLIEGSGFYVNTTNPNDTTDHIVWPTAEVEIQGCLSPGSPRLSTDSIGKPVILYNRFGCGVIAMSHEDHVFSINTPVAGSDNACLKILRTWKVIDWCQKSTQQAPYTYQQIIKVVNKQAPVIGTVVTRDSCAVLPTCTDSILHTLTATASDDCSGSLAWTYSIDLGNNGGAFDIVVNGTGSTINATRKLPLGNHRIIYTFRDLCGNSISTDRVFRLSNCKAPTPFLFEKLAIGIMRMNGGGMITAKAKDFDKGSSHPCGGPLYFAFSATRADSVRTFTCADLGDTTLSVFVGYSFAPGDTVWDNVTVTLSIQDNNTPSACGSTALITKTIRGQLATELNEHLKDAQVFLDGNQLTTLNTNDYGYFEFPQALKGYDYTIKPYKNDDIDNGVNTLDLIRIQKHILGISKLDSPYKMIAADINRDGRVNLGDLVELRKVVLGIYKTIPGNTSWRFIDKAYKFNSVENALTENFNEQYDIERLNDNMTVDFVSVKVGDIDANATTKAQSNQSLSNRSDNKNFVYYDDRYVDKGEYITIPFYMNKNMLLAGLQLGLQFNNTDLEFVDLKTMLTAESENSSYTVNGGEIRFSWNASDWNAVDEVFTVTFRAKSKLRLSDAIENSSFKSEAYNEELETLDLEIRSKSSEAAGFELKQNIPNPFNELTEVEFTLPKASSVSLKVYDLKGSEVYSTNGRFESGKNHISLNSRNIGQAGLYYYTLSAGEFTATKKLVILD